MNKSIALYPGTFDPFTNGHYDLIQRASKLFSKVVVAVAKNLGKNPLLSWETRLELSESVLADLTNVKVLAFENLTADFAQECGAHCLLRGLRTMGDFDYEVQLANMNRYLAPDIETIFMTPAPKLAMISSSLVKQIAELKGDIKAFVHPKVEKVLRDIYQISC